MDRLKITVIGGGSVSWTPNLMRDLLLTPSLSNSEIVLYDLDRKAAQATAGVCQIIADKTGAKARITASDNMAQAFRGANYFVITISTGRLDAMEHDIAIPEKFGIYHTVGDTSGPGGWARAIRNFDVFVGLAHNINRYAPGAMVLNYTNPMVTLTDVLSRLCKGPVVGLCHGLFENLRFLKNFYKVQSEDDLAVQYAGLNHFFWITQAQVGKTDILADMAKRLTNQSITDLLREASLDPLGFKSKREVATELFHLTGVMPYLGDRHTCEFFPWYITSRQNMKKYRIIRTSIAERRKMYANGCKRIQDILKSQTVPDYMLQRTRETAADIINAHSQGKVFIDVGNVPNVGQIDNVPRGVVVETAVRVDRNGFTPIAFGSLPRIVAGFIEPYAYSYPMIVDACFKKDRKLALQALRLDPVCSHLNGDQVTDMGLQLLAAHRKFITAF